MARIVDMREKTNNFYADCEYREMGSLIDEDIGILDWEIFDNKDNLPTAAIKFRMKAQIEAGDESSTYKTATHSKAIIDMLQLQDAQALKGIEPIEARIVERKSKKTGNRYLTFE